MKTRTKIMLIVFVVLMAAGLVLRQRQQYDSLHAENLSLRERTNQISGLEKLRTENQRLKSRHAEMQDLERLRVQQAGMGLLREEAARLQAELAKRAAPQSERGPANELTNTWRVGQILTREDWVDAGQGSPAAALKTYLWAISQGNAEKLRECARIGVPPGYTNDFFAWEIKYRENRWKFTQAAQMVCESRRSPLGSELQVEMISPIRAQLAKLENGQEPQAHRSKETFRLFRDGELWTVDLHVPPQTIEVRLSDNPEERARQIAEQPTEFHEMLKKAPPGRNITLERHALPRPSGK